MQTIFADKNKNVDIFVAGEKFSFLVSGENEHILRQAAGRVEQEIALRRQNSTIKNTERTAIMVALNAASDLLLQQQKIEEAAANVSMQQAFNPEYQSSISGNNMDMDVIHNKLNEMNARAQAILNQLNASNSAVYED